MPVFIAVCFARNADYICLKGFPADVNELLASFLGTYTGGPHSAIVTIEDRC